MQPLLTDEQIETNIRNDAWNQAKQCFGYSYIFSKKALIFEKKLNYIKIVGLIVPFVIGTIALGGNSSVLNVLIYVGGALMIFQAIISFLAILNKWDEKYAYFIESKIDRGNLSEEFKQLSKIPSSELAELKSKYAIAKTKLSGRETQDAKFEVKEWELRMGMRAALREFQSQCANCQVKPSNMIPSDCDVCGNYKKTITYKLMGI